MRFNPALENLKPYKAGPSLAEIKERFHQERVSEMAANEIPWGPFPEVVKSLTTSLERLNRYPDGACSSLRSALSERLSIRTDQLSFGNGSLEVLMLLGQALLSPTRGVVFPHPSFVIYKAIALMHEAPLAAVPLVEFNLDLDAMAAAVTADTSLVIICNPNNPTGGYVPPAVLRSFLEAMPREVVVVLDEAYVEFVTSPEHQDTSRWVDEFPNLVILRTFSKIYGLAGLRIGYAIAQPEVIQAVDKLRQPFNVDSLAQAAATEALRYPERVLERRDIIAAEKSRMIASLKKLDIDCYRGEANFLLVDVTGLSIPGPEVGQELLARGILTRSGYAMDCPGWIRVTIGTGPQNDAFLAAMKDIRTGKVHEHAQVEDAAVDAGSLSSES